MSESEKNHIAGELRKRMLKSQIFTDVPMSRYTSLRLGGKADFLAELACEADALSCLLLAKEYGLPTFSLGRGTNLLVPDEGYRGIILHFGEAFSAVQIAEARGTEKQVWAQAGLSLQRLCRFCGDASLTGLEFACGIPGSVGGAVCMNASAYGGEIKQVLQSVRLLNPDGELQNLSRDEMKLSYRHSLITEQLPPPLVLEAVFSLSLGNQEMIRSTMRDYTARRAAKQPINVPSCGSTFKRPEFAYAGQLIESCGLKGYRIGGCSVSSLHAGFLVNDAGGTASDYIALMQYVKQCVLERTGFTLEPELIILTNPA